jgi:hypothetical protein
VLYNGTENCTGVKVGCPNQFLTNEHCVTSQFDVDLTEVRFEYQRSACNGGTTSFSQSYLGDTLQKDDYLLDYSLFTTFGDSSDYEAAELDPRLPAVGERLYISHHPGGGVKKLSIEDSGSPNGLCRADASPVNGRGTNTDVGYYCDTIGGSSGSPVWSGSTHRVIALHHFGGCLNSGVRMDLIHPQISGLLQPCVPAVCGDGVRTGNEQCDGSDLGGATCAAQGCSGGTPTCLENCKLDYSTCTGCPSCDDDGLCEPTEDCNVCPGDCFTGSAVAVCGNDICETADGEDCLSCPADCNGKQNGKRSDRYCCGDGAGENPVGCGDSRCTGGGNICSTDPAQGSCCGDLVCEGAEDSFNCEVDCGAPPCGDGFCDTASEDSCNCAADCGAPPASEVPNQTCDDGVDNDCGGGTDCQDPDCGDDPACACDPKGAVCDFDSDCCSNKCRGPAGGKTCK